MPITVSTPDAPAALGPYSQAIKVGDFLFMSGQIGLIPSTGQLAEGIEAQVHQAFDNLEAILKSTGGELRQIVKLTLFVADLADFDRINQIMIERFVQPYPARSCVEISALPKGALFEVEAIAHLAA